MAVWLDDETMRRSSRVGIGVRGRGLELEEGAKRMILDRAAHLEAEDERLLRLALARGHSCRALGRMVDASAGTALRRVRSLVRRLEDPLVVALLESPGRLPPLYREIGIRRFLRREPARRIAAEVGCNQWEVYRVNAYLRGWWRAGTEARAAMERALEAV